MLTFGRLRMATTTLARLGKTKVDNVKVNSDHSVAVDQDYFWRPMSSCPRGVKVQLLGEGGVAAYGNWNGHDSFWKAWAPLPKRPPSIEL